jgi:hypothetical protein
MIFEYAIEPSAVVAWGKNRSDYRFFFDKFGLGTSRMMAEFPKFKNWRRQFKKAALQADDHELQRITAIFQVVKEQLVRRKEGIYDGSLSWLENAEEEDKRAAFHAIIALENPRRSVRVLTSQELDNHVLWQLDEQVFCPRIAAEMANLVKGLISNASELHFIDPHFGPENLRHRNPLRAFLEIASSRQGRPPYYRIFFHTSEKSNRTFFQDTCQEELPPLIPEGMRITLRRWKERKGGKELHERLILTDIGGVFVDPGLDEGKPGKEFKAKLLKRNAYEKAWYDYIENPAFDPTEPAIEIIGRGR